MRTVDSPNNGSEVQVVEESQIRADAEERAQNGVTEPKVANAVPKGIRTKKKTTKAAARKKTPRSASEQSEKKGRTLRPYPAGTFEDSFTFASQLYAAGSGTRVRRLTLFDQLGKSPESGTSRQLVTNASKYGLISGSYKSEYLVLTEDGLKAVADPEPKVQKRSQVKLAVLDIEPFKWLYDEYQNKTLPAQQVMRDFLETKGVDKEWLGECVDTFIGNVKHLGLLKVLSGAERLVTLDHLLDEVPSKGTTQPVQAAGSESYGFAAVAIGESSIDYSTTCFYVSPIGDEDSEHRRHSDLFLNHIVVPAVAEFDLNIVRADQIGQAGMITKQIIEHIVRSKLVIADLSFHNPNVFYELALRHACRLPTVQIIRQGDRIPFDLGQVRTVQIDDSNIYSLVPQLQTYKSEIANQVRKALEEGVNAENPISVFFPGLEVKIPA